ncbi:BspA family leucine-rich repeat surface protein [Reichenbachiella versicolor]|uniref:BspA family leucine-rich repeat surface protein n=1 Tax=Reichenbachiella versicolor TaxID=1821036 RepID=UPI000D6E2ECB|nr:BspA family leucine-rich repeat surface protein [Reichenbachiella versicolor]
MKIKYLLILLCLTTFSILSCNDSETAIDEQQNEDEKEQEQEDEINLTLEISDLSIEFPENPEDEAEIGKITVSSENLTEAVSFEISEQSVSGAVSINSDGTLLVADATAFDYESVQSITGKVSASADGLTDEASFTITLTNIVDIPFITKWKTTTAGEDISIYTHLGTERSFSITEDDSDYQYNYTVDWGDGETTSHTEDATHTYSIAGEYTIKILGHFPGILNGADDTNSEKLLTIEQWGDIEWRTMEEAFAYCSNLTYNATDAPDLSRVKSMYRMFVKAYLFNGDISNWDVSKVENMGSLFSRAKAFNQDISKWDVSNIIDMSGMFDGAIAFNQNISKWDVSNVTSMSSMFRGAEAFNQDISKWDISSVTSMPYMFSYATTFSQDISEWDVSNVTNISYMFENASAFNQDISKWEVGKVIYMSSTFKNAIAFKQDLSKWNTINVTSCTGFDDNSGLSSEQLPTKGCFAPILIEK